MKIKVNQNKTRHTVAKQSQLSSMHCSMIKMYSEQPRNQRQSNAIQYQSCHINQSNKKNSKKKKTLAQFKQSKDKTIRQKNSTGRSKQQKLKSNNKNSYSINIQKAKNFKPQAQISYREYFLLQDSFVPVTCNSMNQKIEDKLRSTADTTYRFNDSNKTSNRRQFPFRLRDKNLPSSQSEQNQKSIFEIKLLKGKLIPKQIKNKVLPIYQQIGIQYSERPQLNQIVKVTKSQPIQTIIYEVAKSQQIQKSPKRIQKPNQVVEVNIQTDQSILIQSPVKCLQIFQNQTNRSQQSLSQLLLKLQFKHFPNQKSFQSLSKNQKQHYVELLTSMITKLSSSPRQTGKSCINSKTLFEVQDIKFIPFEEIKAKYQKLEIQIRMRQAYQLNQIQRSSQSVDPNAIDTSMMKINYLFVELFCYIELNYLNEFLENVKHIYGNKYTQQFQRITRKLKIPEEVTEFTVLSEPLYQQFCTDYELQEYQKIHMRAIFDFVNSCLNSFRPFYSHGSQPFPWSIKMYPSICQYVIDQDSFQIIFNDLKQRIEQVSSYLCGLIVDQKFSQSIEDINPLMVKRAQQEEQLIKDFFDQKSNDSHQIQCQSTKFLYQISEQVYGILMAEILLEEPFANLFNL